MGGGPPHSGRESLPRRLRVRLPAIVRQITNESNRMNQSMINDLLDDEMHVQCGTDLFEVINFPPHQSVSRCHTLELIRVSTRVN